MKRLTQSIFHKKKRTILLFLVVLVGLLLASLISRPAASPTFTTQVGITDTGFSPDRIEVKAGEKVTWTNRGNAPHWPASNFHPTHQEYPSEKSGCIGSFLDACRGLLPGESYSFVFDKVGRWGMHDHLYPGLLMTVEIKERSVTNSGDVFAGLSTVGSELVNKIKGLISFSSTPALSVAQFRELDKDPVAQTKILTEMVKVDPAKGWQFLKEAYIHNGQVEGNAHSLAHAVGHQIYFSKGLEGISVCDKSFAYGCFHGVTEQLLLTEGPSVISQVEDLCLKIFPPDKNDNYTGCIHGLGHGLLTQNNLNIARSLNDCDVLHSRYQPYCYDGVFMEYALSGPKNSISQNEPWKLCLELADKYHYNCARYVPVAWQQQFKWDTPTTASVCLRAGQDNLTEPCLQNLGFSAAQISAGDGDEIISLCGSIKETVGQYYCLMGAAMEVKFQNYANWQKVSVQLCRRLPTDWQARCGANNVQST